MTARGGVGGIHQEFASLKKKQRSKGFVNTSAKLSLLKQSPHTGLYEGPFPEHSGNQPLYVLYESGKLDLQIMLWQKRCHTKSLENEKGKYEVL